MRLIFTFLSLILLYSSLHAQVRYRDSVFAITRHQDIVYGSNVDNLNQPTTLLMDVYTPAGDTARFRPVIFFVHGGSFVGGDRTDQSINKIAQFFAHKGYVTVNIEYRVEQAVAISPFLNFGDLYNWYRAIGRVTHDIRAAIRYMKKEVAANNNAFGTDTTRMFIYGSSAGAIGALHAVFLDDTTEMGFFFKTAYRDLGGGIEGNSGSPGYSSQSGIKGVISCSGAIENVEYLNNNADIAYLAFHNNPDLVVPYDRGCFTSVFCHLGFFYGPNKMYPKARSLGMNAEFYPFNYVSHPVDEVAQPETRQTILQKTTDFLYRIVGSEVISPVVQQKSREFSVFPNPASDAIILNLPESVQTTGRIAIYSPDGRLWYEAAQRIQPGERLELDLPNGLYMLTIQYPDRQYHARLLMQH